MKDAQSFGLWTVLDAVGAKWLCRCKCGQERRVNRSDLKSGRSKGCGCTRAAAAGAAAALAARTHGMESTKAYRRWVDMRRRCHNPNRPDYANYGGRGIQVYGPWRESFEAYYADVGEAPSDRHSLDRIDNMGDYAPGNVRWVEQRTQERNKRSNRILQINGDSMTMVEASERFGIPYNTLSNRICTLHWSDADAVLRPVGGGRRPPIAA